MQSSCYLLPPPSKRFVNPHTVPLRVSRSLCLINAFTHTHAHAHSQRHAQRSPTLWLFDSLPIIAPPPPLPLPLLPAARWHKMTKPMETTRHHSSASPGIASHRITSLLSHHVSAFLVLRQRAALFSAVYCLFKQRLSLPPPPLALPALFHSAPTMSFHWVRVSSLAVFTFCSRS